MTLNLNPRFPHVCVKENCAVCRWLSEQLWKARRALDR
jgi:hypothetical protein